MPAGGKRTSGNRTSAPGLTVYTIDGFPVELRTRLKVIAAMTGTTMRDLAILAIEREVRKAERGLGVQHIQGTTNPNA